MDRLGASVALPMLKKLQINEFHFLKKWPATTFSPAIAEGPPVHLFAVAPKLRHISFGGGYVGEELFILVPWRQITHIGAIGTDCDSFMELSLLCPPNHACL